MGQKHAWTFLWAADDTILRSSMQHATVVTTATRDFFSAIWYLWWYRY
jgi:hypothetical protein